MGSNFKKKKIQTAKKTLLGIVIPLSEEALPLHHDVSLSNACVFGVNAERSVLFLLPKLKLLNEAI